MDGSFGSTGTAREGMQAFLAACEARSAPAPCPALPKPAPKSQVRRRLPMVAETLDLFEPDPRPRTRGDCVNGPRPCPYVSCRAHLLLEIGESGNLLPNFPELMGDWTYSGPLHEDGSFFQSGEGRVVEGPHMEAMPATCSLDVADQIDALTSDDDDVTNERIGRHLNLSRERIRQIAAMAFDEIRDAVRRGDIDARVLAELFGWDGPEDDGEEDDVEGRKRAA